MTLLQISLAILALIVCIGVFKFDTFLTFILVSIGLGLARQMDVPLIGKTIQTGIGNTLGDLTLIIGFGAMLGKFVADSGAAARITQALIQLFGRKYLSWGMALAGFIIGIPLFYNAGFVIAVPLVFAVAAQTNLPLVPLGISMLAALSVAHGYLPPHPSPAAIAQQLNADLGKTLLYGICVAIPAIALAGPIFGSQLSKINAPIPEEYKKTNVLQNDNLPSLGISFFVALLPVFLLSGAGLFKSSLGKMPWFQLVSEPYISLFISLLVAIYFLGIQKGKSMKDISKSMEEAFKSIAMMLLIIAGAGALKEIMAVSKISLELGNSLRDIPVHPLVLGWLIAGAVRIAIGSATIAGLTAVGIIAPIFESHPGLSPELMVLSIGAGSLMCSHVNDGGFWMYKEYFQLSIRDTLRTWTIMETLVSIVGLMGVLTLNYFLR
ncbi:MAG: gluconate:H+ symporter [Spirosomataceae bacterium]